jgi:O-antigen ligase
MQISNSLQLPGKLAQKFPGAKGLLLLIPLALSVAMGVLIGRGNWIFALLLALAVPMALAFIARPIVGMVIWLLVMPLYRALPSPQLLAWAIYRILPIVILVLALLPRLVTADRKERFKIGLPEISMLLLAMIVPVTILMHGGNTSLTLIHYGDQVLMPVVMYLALRLMRLDRRDINILKWTALVIILIQTVVGFLSWVAPSVLPMEWHHLVGRRTSGTLEDPAVFTTMIMFCATLLLHEAMLRKRGWVQIVCLTAVGVSFLCVFISLERGSWLAGALVLLGMLAFYGRSIMRLLIVSAVVVLVLGGTLFSQHFGLAADRLGETSQIDDRIVVTDAMFQMIQQKPIMGWGFENLNDNIWRFYRRVGGAFIATGRFQTSHNTYLTIMTEQGAVGLLLYALPAIWLLLRSYPALIKKRAWSFEKRSLLAMLWLGLLQNFVVSNFMDMRFFVIGKMLWFMSLGLIANLLNQPEESLDTGRQLAHPGAQPETGADA